MAALKPWLDGIYKSVYNEKVFGLAIVEGEDVILQGPLIHVDLVEKQLNKWIWKTGIYEETDKKVYDTTGQRHYTVNMYCLASPEDEAFAVVSDDGKLIPAKGQFGVIYTMEWIHKEEAQAIKDDFEDDMDDYEAPPNHYKLRPDVIGKLIWISGAPGFGKSSTAKRMMETHDFVYYEGDCFFEVKNPYLTSSDSSPTNSLFSAKHLKNVPNEIRTALARTGKEWVKLFRGEEWDLSEGYSLMCQNILKERRRVGGDWVIAQAVPSRKMRDLIKEQLGPELVFVVLDLEKDLQLERLRPRVANLGELLNEALANMKVEAASNDEENVIDLKITRDMQLDDVVTMIMDTFK